MQRKRKTASIEVERELVEFVARYARDPAGFVNVAFPWGVPGTPLENFSGPEPWQLDHLEEIGRRLRENPHMPIREAIVSGHGIGKSADVGMVLCWAMSTCADTRCVVTAGTDTQLKTKTAPEAAKWFRMCITAHWFTITATSIYAADPQHEKSWRCDFIPWNEKNPEAFAGLHNQGRRIVFIVDEASQVAEIIFDVIEGAMTDAETEILFLLRGNGTRSSGSFRECFGRFRHRWITRKIDSRTVSFTNKQQIQQWIDDYGEDSDFVRVRVRGDFPNASSMQFIPSSLVDQAMSREPQCFMREPLIIGVDVARFGDDSSVIAFRRGRDACTIPWRTFRGVDTMTLAAEVAKAMDDTRPDAVFVDGGGPGAGVVDRLRQLRREIIEVNFGAGPGRERIHGDASRPANKRAEMWMMMRAWLRGGAIPDDDELEADLTGVEYGYRGPDDETLLESKKDMKKRGLASPDKADALACTFAEPVAELSEFTQVMRQKDREQENDYNPYSADRV